MPLRRARNHPFFQMHDIGRRDVLLALMLLGQAVHDTRHQPHPVRPQGSAERVDQHGQNESGDEESARPRRLAGCDHGLPIRVYPGKPLLTRPLAPVTEIVRSS